MVGLATYGYNVTRAMGVKLAKLSPTRGFAAELATAGVITVAAQCAPVAQFIAVVDKQCYFLLLSLFLSSLSSSCFYVF